MAKDEAAWRRAYEAATDPGTARSGCLSAEVLGKIASGEAPVAARQRAADHLATCAACAQELRLARSLQPWAEGAAGAIGAAPPPGRFPVQGRRWHRWRVPATVAAGLLLGLLGLLSTFTLMAPPSEPPGTDLERGGPSEVLEPAAGARLVAPPRRFQWPAQAGAARYTVELFDRAGQSRWRGVASAQPSVSLPEEIQESLGEGSYFWIVEVTGPVARPRLGPYAFCFGERCASR
jgi:anti-sigma factor RsiW